MYMLYGDGVHDDAPAIQELLDSGISAVVLPAPAKNYAIGSTLVIHSGQSTFRFSTASTGRWRDYLTLSSPWQFFICWWRTTIAAASTLSSVSI